MSCWQLENNPENNKSNGQILVNADCGQVKICRESWPGKWTVTRLIGHLGSNRPLLYRCKRTAPSVSNIICGAFAFVFYYPSFSASSPSHFSHGITKTN